MRFRAGMNIKTGCIFSLSQGFVVMSTIEDRGSMNTDWSISPFRRKMASQGSVLIVVILELGTKSREE